MVKPLDLARFTGGLNTTSDPSTIADVELAECVNFEQDLDGSLKSRPPLKEIFGHQNFTNRVLFLCEAVFGTDHYLICSTSTGIYYFINGAFTLITATFEAGAAVQYADKVYLVPKPGSGSGGKWDPSGGFVAVAAIPKGQAAVVHKERLYVCPGIKSTVDTSRLKFSDAANLDSWPGANFIDIRQGDGNKLVDLTVYQDNLLLFKEQSTHMLAYDANPADAFLRPISDHIGVNQQWNVVNYENQVYIFSGGWVYEITNLDFTRINVKIPFIRDETTPSAFSDEFIFLSLLEDRLICRYYRKIYVYGLRTRSWSEWDSDINELHFFGPIITVRPLSGNEYYAGSCLQANTTVIKLLDKQNATDTERSFSTTAIMTDTYSRVTSNGLGVADTGQTYTNSGGAVSDYSTTGTKGQHNLTTVNVARLSTVNSISVANFDVMLTFSTNKLAVGGTQNFELKARVIDANNYLYISGSFTTTQTVTYSLIKVVAGVSTSISSGTVAGLVHAANKDFTVRFKGTGGILQLKIWETLSGQPAGWTVSTFDSAITAAGGASFATSLGVGSSNAPVVASFDNLSIINTELTTSSITCFIKTKNYDMASSHQFKRLWWWGLDCITNNVVVGTASPITSSFVVTWDQLQASYNWDQLNTWDQPLTAPTVVTTTRPTGMGVLRQFIKFDKGLRYRQISFTVTLTTVGSTADGPAKIFTMTIMTRPSQVVSKAVS